MVYSLDWRGRDRWKNLTKNIRKTNQTLYIATKTTDMKRESNAKIWGWGWCDLGGEGFNRSGSKTERESAN